MLGWIAKPNRQMWHNRNCFACIYGIFHSLVSKITATSESLKFILAAKNGLIGIMPETVFFSSFIIHPYSAFILFSSHHPINSVNAKLGVASP